MSERKREIRRATVTATERLSDDLVRLTFDCPALAGADLAFTDHYIKILFPPADADYSWPFDPEQIRTETPQLAPVTRTYTLRRHDRTSGQLVIDFVEHGDSGLAGPWARAAQPGDEIGFHGPGGAWAPSADYDHFVLAGDEAAAPAIAAAIEALPTGATAQVYLEVNSPSSTFAMPQVEGVELTWVARNGAPYGAHLVDAVRAGGVPQARTGWFIHGVAEMIKDLRRFLFVENSVAKDDVSISGYWRIGMTEDQWQSSKRDFNQSMIAEEEQA